MAEVNANYITVQDHAQRPILQSAPDGAAECSPGRAQRTRGSLYGHVHNRLAAEDAANARWLTKDVGVDACDYRPWSFEELRGYMAPRLDAFRAWKQSLPEG